jgi:hypothetical protein
MKFGFSGAPKCSYHGKAITVSNYLLCDSDCIYEYLHPHSDGLDLVIHVLAQNLHITDIAIYTKSVYNQFAETSLSSKEQHGSKPLSKTAISGRHSSLPSNKS